MCSLQNFQLCEDILIMSETNFSSEDSSDDEEISEEALQEISTKINRDFDQEARSVIEQDSLPKKSQDRYKLVYDTFIKWKNDNQASSFDESVLICYFKDCEKKSVSSYFMEYLVNS